MVTVSIFTQHIGFLGGERPALPSEQAESDPPRRQALQHINQSQRCCQDVRLWHIGLPGGLHRKDNRRGVQTLHGCEFLFHCLF